MVRVHLLAAWATVSVSCAFQQHQPSHRAAPRGHSLSSSPWQPMANSAHKRHQWPGTRRAPRRSRRCEPPQALVGSGLEGGEVLLAMGGPIQAVRETTQALYVLSLYLCCACAAPVLRLCCACAAPVPVPVLRLCCACCTCACAVHALRAVGTLLTLRIASPRCHSPRYHHPRSPQPPPTPQVQWAG